MSITMENISFKNSKGFNLSGTISIPGNQDKVPFVMICHGLHSSKNGSTYKNLAEILFNNNIASFRFDFVGHGESEGTVSDLTFSQSVEDLKAAFDVISDYSAVDLSKIGLFGRSFGGNISLRYAAQSDNLKLLCLNAPAIDWREIFASMHSADELKEWEKQGYIYKTFRDITYKIGYSFYLDAVNADIYKICKKIRTNVFIVHGEEDKTVPCSQSLKLKDAIENNAGIAVIEGADHEFNPNKQGEAIKRCADFIMRNL